MKFKINPNITTTLLVGAAIIGLTQTTISAASTATDQRFVQLEARMDARFDGMEARFKARFEHIDARFQKMDAHIDARFERMDQRFEKIDERFEKMDARIDDLAAGIARLEGLIQGFHATPAAKVANALGE